MKRRIINISVYTILIVLLLGTISFSGAKRHEEIIHDVVVEIATHDGQFYTDHVEIAAWLQQGNDTTVLFNLPVDEVPFKLLERKVEEHPFVKEAEVFHDLKGNLVVSIDQVVPVARIFSGLKKDMYIDDVGELLPTIGKQAARVPIIYTKRNFSWDQSIAESEYGQHLLAMLKFIRADEFWQAQIAELEIQENGELKMWGQVSKQEILFGMPEDVDKKLKKLKLFYTQILPNKGWNTYNSVNLKFKDQIVCE